MYGHTTYNKSMDQPSKVANLARGQLNRVKLILPCPRSYLRIWSRETGSAVLSRVSLFISIYVSLRNLVSGYECGRVFSAGVGPGSPSRDAVNWLPSRFSLSVETRRRYGWLRMMVFPGAHLFGAPIWCPSGGWRHARGREHCRGEPGSSLSGGYAPDAAKAEGSSIIDEPGGG